jgi:hypothetical protein
VTGKARKEATSCPAAPVRTDRRGRAGYWESAQRSGLIPRQFSSPGPEDLVRSRKDPLCRLVTRLQETQTRRAAPLLRARVKPSEVLRLVK